MRHWPRFPYAFGETASTLGVGSVICLVVGMKGFVGTLGEVALTFGEPGVGRTKFYPKITLKQRETYPTGVAYVTLAIVWPAIVSFLCRGWLLPM